ncbi:tetratricopeptide repeat protein [Candidatus Woesearchaeota archaeon]|nr:tetratricopeptide repeat protein [Candidatus Woesearchaeota archaeon]
MSDIEEQMIQSFERGKNVQLERALLIASGLDNESAVGDYQKKIDEIQRGFRANVELKKDIGNVPKGKLLFDYFWESKPKRVVDSNTPTQPAHYQLSDVVDAQLNPDINKEVGNCLGLTSLYVVLGLRDGLDLSILASRGENGHGHVRTRLREGGKVYDTEHIDHRCFDGAIYPEPDREKELHVSCLIQKTYMTRAASNFLSGNVSKAKEDCEKALRLDPKNKANQEIYQIIKKCMSG